MVSQDRFTCIDFDKAKSMGGFKIEGPLYSAILYVLSLVKILNIACAIGFIHMLYRLDHFVHLLMSDELIPVVSIFFRSIGFVEDGTTADSVQRPIGGREEHDGQTPDGRV